MLNMPNVWRGIALAVLVAGAAWAQGADAASPNGRVAMLTDYGTDSLYVGLLKGAMYSKNPDVRIDSITNDVPAFDIVAGAYLLAEGCQTWPKGTVFCCVVDPGVGTPRKPIVMATKNGWWFVAPDNGLLTLVAERYGVAELRECANAALWRGGNLSTTFHGRDIFGPVAAAVAGGVPMNEIGPILADFVRLDLPKARVEDGAAHGAVVRIDTYGNMITSIRAEDLEALGIRKGDGVDITVGRERYAAPYVTTYGEVPPGDRLLVVQSSGFVELAANMNSLAESLGEELRAPVIVRKAESAH